MDLKVIGRKIRELRARIGLTTVTLAKKVRLSQAQVSRLENGLQGFRAATLIKFAKALNVPTIYFFVEGEGAATARTAKELQGRRLEMSRGLRKALANPAFLHFMERRAKAFVADRNKLAAMKVAVKRVVRDRRG